MLSRNSGESGDESSASSYYNKRNTYTNNYTESESGRDSSYYGYAYESGMKNETPNLNSLQQFLKPIEHNFERYENSYEDEMREEENVSYNDMFGNRRRKKH